MMTIGAVSPVYEFRPFSRATEERSTARSPSGPRTAKPQQLDLFSTPTTPADEAKPPGKAVVKYGRGESVSDLFDRFFQDKIRRHDADRDGRLSREEFYGSEEQFAGLDEDQDGYIGAPDLKRQFLEANPEMREMVEGFAGRLYDQMLNSPSSDPEDLARIVEDFFADFVAQNDADNDGLLDADEFPGTGEEFRRIAEQVRHSIHQDDLIESFQRENPDLVQLRESLLELKEMVRPQQGRPQHIDVYT